MFFCYDIDSCASMDSNDVGLQNTKGFDFLNGLSIFAHYTNHRTKLTEKEQVIAQPEEDTIFINGTDVEVIGTLPYYRFRNDACYTIEIEYKEVLKIKLFLTN